MKVKNVVVLCLVLLLVAGVAVNGSRAQPLNRVTSDAYRNCVGKAGQRPPIVLERCRPVGEIVVAQTEFEANFDAVGGVGAGEAGAGIGADGDVTGGERWREVAQQVLQLLTNLVNLLNVLQVMGGGLPDGMEIAYVDTLFDPAR